MSRPVKYISSVLVLVLVMAAVAGIAYWTSQYDPDAIEPGLYQNGKKVEEPAVMLTVGEHEVSFDVYRHYFLLYKGYFEEYYGSTFYDEDPDGDRVATLKRMVEVELVNTYAWLEIAEENGVTLDDEDIAEINETLQEQRDTYGASFERQLEEMHYTSEENYLEIARLQALMNKAKTAYREKIEDENSAALGAEADKLFQEEKLRAKHILVNVDEEALDYEEAKQEALEKAEVIYTEILANAGNDLEAAFDAAMNEYSEDPGLETNPDGYVFGDGEMVEIFYDTTLSLEPGEMAAPVLSEAANYTGYHIILRLPLTDEDMDENRTTYIGTEVSNMVTERELEGEERLTLTYPDFYAKMGADDIR